MSRHGQQGMSLVEMMIVLALISIISGIAAVGYQDYLETSRIAALQSRIDGFRMFEDNYRIDNGTFLAGDYEPGGVNDFEVMGYEVDGDSEDVTLRVTACDGGAISECYQVIASNSHGETLIWDNGTYRQP